MLISGSRGTSFHWEYYSLHTGQLVNYWGPRGPVGLRHDMDANRGVWIQGPLLGFPNFLLPQNRPIYPPFPVYCPDCSGEAPLVWGLAPAPEDVLCFAKAVVS